VGKGFGQVLQGREVAKQAGTWLLDAKPSGSNGHEEAQQEASARQPQANKKSIGTLPLAVTEAS
jgi:hypothetical protein